MPKTQQEHQAEPIQTAASVVWFEIPADNPARAKKFYDTLFGWKFPGARRLLAHRYGRRR
jgi:uncharacterized protein